MNNTHLILDIMNVIKERDERAWPHKQVRFRSGNLDDIPFFCDLPTPLFKATPGLREEIDANIRYAEENNISLRDAVSREMIDYRFITMEAITHILTNKCVSSFCLYAEKFFEWLGVTDETRQEKEDDNNFWRNFVLALNVIPRRDARIIKLYDQIPFSALENEEYNFVAESRVGTETDEVGILTGTVLRYFGVSPRRENDGVYYADDVKEFFDFFNLEPGLKTQERMYPSYYNDSITKQLLDSHGTPHTYVYNERYSGYHD